jgi:hypothetical protein
MAHQEQIDREGKLRFYTVYLLDYLRNLARYRNHGEAYRRIRYEAEAFEKERED